MKLSKLIPATLSVLTAVTLTGCFPTGEVSDPAPSQTAPATSTAPTSGDASVPSDTSAPANTVLTVGDKVTIDITPPASYPSEVPIIKCHLRDFLAESEEIKKFFIDGKEIYKEESFDNSTNYFTTDGATLSISKQGDLSYTPDDHLFDGNDEMRSKFKMMDACVRNIEYYHGAFPHMADELEGFPRADALARANELVKQFDIQYLGEPIIYSVSAEDAHNYDENITLTKEEEFYIVQYPMTYNGISVSADGSKVNNDIENNPSWLKVVLSKDKLIKFQCHFIFDNIEEVEEVQIACSADNAVTKLYNNYEPQEMMLQNKYDFTDSINLVYGSWKLDNFAEHILSYKPFWCVPGLCQIPNDPKMYSFNVYIDVGTGMVSIPAM